MPKYRVEQEVTIKYFVIIDAPSREAVETFYEAEANNLDYDSEESVTGLNGIFRVADDTPEHICIDEDGEMI